MDSYTVLLSAVGGLILICILLNIRVTRMEKTLQELENRVEYLEDKIAIYEDKIAIYWSGVKQWKP